MELLQSLEEIIGDISAIKAELILALSCMVILMVSLFNGKQILYKLIFGGSLTLAWYFTTVEAGLFFFDRWEIDGFGLYIKYLIILTGILVLFYNKKPHKSGEYYFLLLSVIIGSFVMISARHFLLLYLAIEITSYASYFLTGIQFSRRGIEGSMKYYLFGAVSSAVMLFGMSLLYGASGSLHFEFVDSQMGNVGFVMLLAGLLFKTSIVPFHLWTPGAYQSAPTQVVAVFSIVPKLAGFSVIYYLVVQNINPWIEKLLLVIAIVTVIVGTLSAIRQENAKRLLAYGAIAHSGFMLPLLLIPAAGGVTAFAYYAIIYLLMNVGVFYLVELFEDSNGDLSVKDLKGMGDIYPYTGIAFLLLLVGLIGLPPTGGFTAKLLLFTFIWDTYLLTDDILWFTFFVIGILSSAVSLYYYLKIPYYYYLKKGDGHSTQIFRVQTIIATFFAIVLLLVFIQPNILNSFVSILRVSEQYIP